MHTTNVALVHTYFNSFKLATSMHGIYKLDEVTSHKHYTFVTTYIRLNF